MELNGRKRILVAGGGFAGLYALKQLARCPDECEIILFDGNEYTAMLPSLPDVAGGFLNTSAVRTELKSLIPARVEWKQEKVTKVDLDSRIVQTGKDEYTYDYLVVAVGSRADFHGFSENLSEIFRLDSLSSAELIRDSFDRYLDTANGERHVVISGAGYTGIELVTSLYFSARKKGVYADFSLVDIAGSILPHPMFGTRERGYIEKYLKKLGIQFLPETRVTGFDGQILTLNGNNKILNPFLCWTAGSRLSLEEVSGEFEQIGDGRITVDPCLQIPGYEHTFVCGDAAAVQRKGTVLRKAVNFAVGSGACAGRNIRRIISGREPKPFRPLDLGWVIPFHSSSVGRIFGKIPVKGKLGLRLHFLMAGWRSYSVADFLSYLKRSIILYR